VAFLLFRRPPAPELVLPVCPHTDTPHPSSGKKQNNSVARALADAYGLVYDALTDPRSGYGEAGGAGAVKHTPAQVRTVLGVPSAP
jgi:hypothetical protein